jgi:hypothetical protein
MARKTENELVADEEIVGTAGDDLFIFSEESSGLNRLFGYGGEDEFLALGLSPTQVDGGAGADIFEIGRPDMAGELKIPAGDRSVTIQDFSSEDTLRLATLGQPVELRAVQSRPGEAAQPYDAVWITEDSLGGSRLLLEQSGDTQWDYEVLFTQEGSLQSIPYAELQTGITTTGFGAYEQTISLTSVSGNASPEAEDDSADTAAGEDVSVNVLDNDQDREDDTLSVANVAAPDNGTASIADDATVLYTPDDGFVGTDHFIYTVVDSDGATDTARVTVTVTDDQAPTIPADQSFSLQENAPVNTVLGSIEASDNAAVTSFTIVGGEALDWVRLTDTGQIVLNQAGADSALNDYETGQNTFTLEVQARDESGNTSATQTIALETQDIDDEPPQAQPDEESTVAGQAVTINVLANDSDPDTQNLQLIDVTDPAHGQAEITNFGLILYTPEEGYSGEDSFEYTVSDGNGGKAQAEISVTVGQGNYPETAKGLAQLAETSEVSIYDTLSHEGQVYALLRNVTDDSDVRHYSGGGGEFPQSELLLAHVGDGNEVSYTTLDKNLYMDNRTGTLGVRDGQIVAFANSKDADESSYTYDGFTYQVDPNSLEVSRSYTFSKVNWGWFPSFDDNGNLQHFSFAGYYWVKGGEYLESVDPGEAEKQSFQKRLADFDKSLAPNQSSFTAFENKHIEILQEYGEGDDWTSAAEYYLLNQDADRLNTDVDGDGEVDLLANISVNGLVFSVNGVEHTIQFDDNLLASGGILNHQDFATALQPALDQLIQNGSVPADISLGVDNTRTTRTYLDDGTVSSDIPAIVIQSHTESVVEAVGFSWVEDAVIDYNLYGRFDSRVADVVSADDYTADETTKGEIEIGGIATGTIEEGSDEDWFAASLQAGTTYQINLKGADTVDGTLTDPNFKGIYSSGKDGVNLISGTTDKDGGTGLNSQVEFTPETSGTYYLAAGSSDDTTGTYTLSVTQTQENTPTWGKDDNFILPQYASPGIIGSGIGNDIYLLSPSLITPGQEITLSDSSGTNSIQLADGLQISSSQVASNALQLTLNNNAEITILDADRFTYEPGANHSAGIDNTYQSFSQFISQTLGTSVPTAGVNTGSAVTIGSSAQDALPVSSAADNFIAPQYASPDIVGSGIGDDTYLLTPSLIGSGQEMTLSDSSGANSIQLADGLQISSSQVASNALQLTLSNNAEITILGADQFTYEPGGNRSAGIDNTDLSYTGFVSTILGTNIPENGVNQGESVSIGNESDPDYIQLGSTDTFTATPLPDVFSLEVDEALADTGTTQVTVNGFDINEDSLRLDLPGATGPTTLAALNGTQGVTAQADPFTGNTLISFGQNASSTEVALTLVGVTDFTQVEVMVV